MPGIPGVPGPQGPQGRDGVKGQIGDKGSQGMPGPRGGRGREGPPGKSGPTGIKGIKGEPGLVGRKGEQGVAGMIGERGIVGNQGRKGNKGEKGESVKTSQAKVVPQTNWKQCVWMSDSDTDSGKIKVNKNIGLCETSCYPKSSKSTPQEIKQTAISLMFLFTRLLILQLSSCLSGFFYFFTKHRTNAI